MWLDEPQRGESTLIAVLFFSHAAPARGNPHNALPEGKLGAEVGTRGWPKLGYSV